MSNNRFSKGNSPGYPMNDPELVKMAMMHEKAMKEALEENAEVHLAACPKCGISDLTMVTQAEVFIVRVPEMPTQGIEGREEMVPRPRIIQFYCPVCGDLVAQKILQPSANPNVVDRDKIDTKEVTTEDGHKIVVPDIEKDLEEVAPIEEEEKEEPSDPTT
jgi:predicted RNA-binding Zn-ribbon protein involved in translation (DUF1610 family)